MKVTIPHDDRGVILSIAKIEDLQKAGSKFASVGMIPGPGQNTLDVDLADEPKERSLLELHREYRVDIASTTLVKRHTGGSE